MNEGRGYDVKEALGALDPAALDYTEWLNVGMALKAEGYDLSVWEDWSRGDAARYHSGECARKWAGFTGTGVAGGTLIKLAMDHGWSPDAGEPLNWDSVIGAREDGAIVDANWIEEREIAPLYPKWQPAQELKRYLELLFESSENVGYVTETWYNEDRDRYLPTKGSYDRTAGELIEALSRCSGDVGAVIGDYKREAGAWIRFNPLDGQGVKNENVTDFRYALVESDCMSIGKQYALIRELELPAVVLVHSGGKSLHAIVRIEAGDYSEYRKRVDYLYGVCEKNGLKLDSQNRNPSRLSRMPGILRGENRQYIVAENIGKASFSEWKEWIEAANDDLPDMQSLSEVWNNMPPLSPPLIEGVLRQGHKLLLSGPSKAGKSFALIELCAAIAEGREWLGFHCAQGSVLYINLELDPASCKHRFKDVYAALGWESRHIDNIAIWDLRGRVVPLDQLAPRLIRRCRKRRFSAVIFDPIYKIITGDENSADEMAKFCNQFDRICAELGCAVIYCHHHSKGSQGGKRSMDRASGSGVFARDPDAMIDLLELNVPETMRVAAENEAGIEVCARRLDQTGTSWREDEPRDILCSLPQMLHACRLRISASDYDALICDVDAARQRSRQRTAWRIEGTLREFNRFEPRNMWFEYPIHKIDESDILHDCSSDGDARPRWEGRAKAASGETGDKKQAEKEGTISAFEACRVAGRVTVQALAEYMGVTEKTVRNRVNRAGCYVITENTILEKSE